MKNFPFPCQHKRPAKNSGTPKVKQANSSKRLNGIPDLVSSRDEDEDDEEPPSDIEFSDQVFYCSFFLFLLCIQNRLYPLFTTFVSVNTKEPISTYLEADNPLFLVRVCSSWQSETNKPIVLQK